jgi:aminomethyltransferase
MHRTQLYAFNQSLGAKFVEFAGYEMPVQFPAGLIAEHKHTREAAGLFDVSHMGQVIVSGPSMQSVHTALERALPIDFAQIAIGQQKYSYLLNDQGTILDDLMLVNLGSTVAMVLNAGCKHTDLERLRALCPELTFTVVDAALVALQGPQAEAVLAAMDPAAADMTFMTAKTLKLNGVDCFTTRSGYTGEDGYEISIPAAYAEAVCKAMCSNPAVKPIGLGARDTLRLEAGLCLYGNDIDTTTSPVEGALTWAIPKSRRAGGEKAGGFPGAEIVLAQIQTGVSRKLVGLVSEERVPIRAHASIVDAAGGKIGEVTSGTLAPTAGKPIMLAYVPTAQAAVGTVLAADVRGRAVPVTVVKLPFVEKRYKR